MELDITNLDPERKEKIKTIVELGKAFGGTPEVDDYLMGELLSVYLPEETSNIDTLASAYSLTEDEAIKSLLTKELYKTLGMNPEDATKTQTYLNAFKQEFPIEGNPANANLWAVVQEHPEILEQYYNPTIVPFSGGANVSLPGVSTAPKNESEKERRERLESLVSQYKSNLPINGLPNSLTNGLPKIPNIPVY